MCGRGLTVQIDSACQQCCATLEHTGKIVHSHLLTPQIQKKKMHPTTVYQSNSNRPDSSCILVLCLQHRFVCCSSSHNPLISSGLGSDLCLIHHHPNRPQRTNLIPEPRRQHMDTSDTKPRTFILTALESEPIVLTEGYAKKKPHM